MHVSVVLTTYNGKKYIEELLDSLRMQTKTIDELLVCDDGSNDGTPELITDYIIKYALPWKVQVNTINKGWKKNFRDGILQARGDIVFPCDQDDIWELDKIEKMTQVMAEQSDILLLSSDYAPLYEHGGRKVEEFYSHRELIEKVTFDSHFALGNRPGCVMAIRRKLLEKVNGIWQDWYPHDAFLWTCAAFLEGCYIIHQPLIRYRRHSSNTTNHATRNKEAVVLSLRRNINLSEWMLNENLNVNSETKKIIIKRFREFAKLRLDLIANKKVKNFFILFRYREYYRSMKQEIGDIYLMLKK
jgi:glycosyltransferase involved in cell wall biosynthesis